MAKTTAKTSKKSTAKPRNVAASAPREYVIPDSYEPISMWGYFGYEFLFAIPVVGWILCISFAFMAQNHNLRNFARSQFCYLIISVVIICLLAGLGILSAVIGALSA